MIDSTPFMRSLPVPPGVYAALATPTHDDASTDFATLESLIDFLVERGVSGVAVGGATGEYPSFSIQERIEQIRRTVAHANGRMKVLAGIGAQTASAALALGEAAAESNCSAVLLPMPSFFRYQQEDLEAYCRSLASQLSTPCLFYHLPSFTNSLTSENLARVLETEPNLLGAKDSSGQRGNLQLLLEARNRRPFTLFVGDDSLALDALIAGWDGVISGIACFLPELLVGIFRNVQAGKLDAAKQLGRDLDEIIAELVKLPVPWAIRLGLRVRGLPIGPLNMTPSPKREQQIAAYSQWLERWLEQKSWAQPLAALK